MSFFTALGFSEFFSQGFGLSYYLIPLLFLSLRILRKFGRLGKLLTLALVCSAVFGQSSAVLAKMSLGQTLKQDAKTVGLSAKKIAESPFHASGKSWLIAGGLAGGIFASSFLDDRVRTEIRSHTEPWTKTVDDIGHLYQNAALQGVTAVALYGIGYATDNPRVRIIGVEIVEAYAIAGIGTQAVKHLVGRARPYEGLGNDYFRGPTLSNAYHSFPSGDVTQAFCFSAVLASELRSWPVTVGLFGLASATAFQRMHKDKHWFSDTVGAAVWGTAVGLGVVRVNRKLLGKEFSLAASGLTLKF